MFDSKKQLFESLGLACSAGNTRKAAEKTVNQHMRLVPIGKRKIRIDEIYDTIHKREDKRSERALELEREFDIVLTQFFRSQKRKYYTIDRLAVCLQCYSTKTASLMCQSDENIAVEGFTPYVFDLFYRHMRKTCKRLLLSRLRRLENKDVILFREGIMVRKRFYDDSTTEYAEFLRLRQQCVSALGYTSLSQAMFGFKRRTTFFAAFNALLRDNNLPEAYICFRLENLCFGTAYTQDEAEQAAQCWNSEICTRVYRAIKNEIERTNKRHQADIDAYWEALTTSADAVIPQRITHYFYFDEQVLPQIIQLINRSMLQGTLLPEGKETYWLPQNTDSVP